MALPTAPPLDPGPNLTLGDVKGCFWYRWKRRFKDEVAYPAPNDLAGAKIKDSFPERPWGPTSDKNGIAIRYFQVLLDTMETAKAYRANLNFKAFVDAYDNDKTWGDFAKVVYDARVAV
jgi:hypothetical protein